MTFIGGLKMTEKYTWKVKTYTPRVQWVEKDFMDRSFLESYLEYFGIANQYKGPGTYETPDGFVLEITCNRTEE